MRNAGHLDTLDEQISSLLDSVEVKRTVEPRRRRELSQPPPPIQRRPSAGARAAVPRSRREMSQATQPRPAPRRARTEPRVELFADPARRELVFYVAVALMIGALVGLLVALAG